MDATDVTTYDDSTGDALQAKIVTMVCLFAISMAVSCLPLLLSLKFDWFTKSDGLNVRSSNQLVMGLLAFGGGVLFATSFMHLLPEVDENIHLLQETGDLPELPLYLASLIMCSGFFMMYLIEELVHVYINSRNAKTAKGSFARALSIRKDNEEGHSSSETPMTKEQEAKNHIHVPMEHSADDTVGGAFRGLLIVLALSIHELFEGLAVGLESSTANVWYMFAAVSAHKYIIGFCIGVELLAAGTRRWLSVVYIFTYSFMSALGIGIGILLVGGAGAAQAGIYSVVLQGLACGTLVYAVFFEVWHRDGTGILQFVWSFVGFAVMVCLDVIVEIFA